MRGVESTLFSTKDADAIFSLAERLTGNNVRGNLVLANVERRLEATGCRTLFEYLRHVESNQTELQQLISALVIHTTSFFREEPHYAVFLDFLERNYQRFLAKPLRVLSAACSTGEEVYSFGLILEAFRQKHPGFQYQIEGRDIDVLCTNKAARAVYPLEDLKRIPDEYRDHILVGTGKTEGLFTVSRELRKRCSFSNWNLAKIGNELSQQPRFDYVICRNVLIYFTPDLVKQVVARLVSVLHPGGLLCLGHSESVDAKQLGLELRGNSVYQVTAGSRRESLKLTDKRVLIVDDSPAVRKIMKRLLEGSGMSAVLAESAEEATTFLESNSVDLITLDLRLPGVNGQDWLVTQRARGMRIPVVIISEDYPSEAGKIFGALENGAQDYFHKGEILTGREDLLRRFSELIESFAEERGRGIRESFVNTGKQKLRRPELIVIGASIGGPEALGKLLKDLPADCPPVMVVQHISVNFAHAFAQHVASVSGLRLPTLSHGMPLERGCLYMASGDHHIGARRRPGDSRYTLVLSDAPAVKRHRPSIDFLFRSVAESDGGDTLAGALGVLAAILTGMGTDGAEGLMQLKQAGAMTFAQDQKSCVVFGMAKEAIRLGAVGHVGDLRDLRRQLDGALAAPGLNGSYNDPAA